jgi:hypothetical protein
MVVVAFFAVDSTGVRSVETIRQESRESQTGQA